MNSIYKDIAERTNGDIYIGVVGPVRTGKSTFVTKFVEKIVLPKITDINEKQRALDALPQSADGKTIMTTQPNFVPSSSVAVAFDDKTTAKIRLVDCVGYLVEGAEGAFEGTNPRQVSTPWSSSPMPFEKAAEIGTHKVVAEHSTIAVVVTTDGTICNLPRQNYVSAEERVVRELKMANKPFVVLVNSANPQNESCIQLANALQEKYGVLALPINIKEASQEQCEHVIKMVLSEFSIKRIAIHLPKWMRALHQSNSIIAKLLEKIKIGTENVCKMKDIANLQKTFAECDFLESAEVTALDMATGVAECALTPKKQLFFQMLAEQSNTEIDDEYGLMKYVVETSGAKQKFESIAEAMDQADRFGYGVVCPNFAEMSVEEPSISKQGNVYGVQLKASAPSYHVIKIDVKTQVNPMVGTEEQSKYLLEQYKQNPEAVWQTNMFGKTMKALVEDGLAGKCQAMPQEVKQKLTKTVGRIVNENKGGLICFLL